MCRIKKYQLIPLLKMAGVSLLFFISVIHSSLGQTAVIDKKSFFKDTGVIGMKITTDLKKLIYRKDRADYEQNVQPATITFLFPDSLKITQETEIRPRGDFRRQECYMPPVKINFKTDQTGALKKLGNLKFVWPCENTAYAEQLVLKEYLVYRIFNLVSEKSFRVRLVKVESDDSKDRLKSHQYYGFFIEDVDDLAKRNGCIEIDSVRYYTEQTNRVHTTLTTLFQYMIGNTDWGIPVYHNIKLIRQKEDSLAYPFVIPFDFDCSGLVDASYALPDLSLGISSVRERVYRGFPRALDELQAALQVLRNQRKAIESLILNCGPLSDKNKQDMIEYLNQFYSETVSEEDIERKFIKRSRYE